MKCKLQIKHKEFLAAHYEEYKVKYPECFLVKLSELLATNFYVNIPASNIGGQMSTYFKNLRKTSTSTTVNVDKENEPQNTPAKRTNPEIL